MKQRLLNKFHQNQVDPKRLCRSQENLSHSYLKTPPNVIIIEKNSTQVEKSVSHADLPSIDEIPKPGRICSMSFFFFWFELCFSRFF